MCARANQWLGQAKKGERFVYYRGAPIKQVLRSPEQRLTKEERDKFRTERRLIRELAALNGVKPKYPPTPDPHRRIRADVAALVELVEHHKFRGLIDVQEIVYGDNDHAYEMVCLIQRNGLKAVRDRERAIFRD